MVSFLWSGERGETDLDDMYSRDRDRDRRIFSDPVSDPGEDDLDLLLDAERRDLDLRRPESRELERDLDLRSEDRGRDRDLRLSDFSSSSNPVP